MPFVGSRMGDGLFWILSKFKFNPRVNVEEGLLPAPSDPIPLGHGAGRKSGRRSPAADTRFWRKKANEGLSHICRTPHHDLWKPSAYQSCWCQVFAGLTWAFLVSAKVIWAVNCHNLGSLRTLDLYKWLKRRRHDPCQHANSFSSSPTFFKIILRTMESNKHPEHKMTLAPCCLQISSSSGCVLQLWMYDSRPELPVQGLDRTLEND